MLIPYIYKSTVLRIIDGDTIELDVDCGFHLKLSMHGRLLGVDTPETRGETKEQGLISKEFVETVIPPGSKIIIRTEKDDALADGLRMCIIQIVMDQ